MRWRLSFAALTWIAMLALGCARRDAPYRFRSPLVGAVAAAEVRPPVPASLEARRQPAPRQPAPDRKPPAARREHSPAVATLVPVPYEAPAQALSGDGRTLADWLRSLVGARDPEVSNVELAIRCLVAMGARLDADIRGTRSGPDLVALARSRDALVSPEAKDTLPLLGDLVVFDNVEPDEPASLVGVVVSTDARGTIEIIYLARGIVRRGFVTPARPGETRDASGRALNTFVRAGRPGDPLDSEYLSSDLYAGYIRLDKLQK